MLLSPNADDLAQLAIDEDQGADHRAGNPGKYIADWKNAGIKVMRSLLGLHWQSAWSAQVQMRLSQRVWKAAATSVS